MNNVLSAKLAIDAEISLLEGRLKACETIKAELEKLSLNENTGQIDVVDNSLRTDQLNINPEQFADYPFNKRLFEKLKYLDDKFPRVWKMKSRLELMVQIEGKDSRIRFRNMSQDMKNLINTGMYIGAKYNNDNKCQFYCRPEWISEDKKSIKPEHAPTAEDFGMMPEYKRKNELINWVTAK
jgi:hypothetical protein